LENFRISKKFEITENFGISENFEITEGSEISENFGKLCCSEEIQKCFPGKAEKFSKNPKKKNHTSTTPINCMLCAKSNSFHIN